MFCTFKAYHRKTQKIILRNETGKIERQITFALRNIVHKEIKRLKNEVIIENFIQENQSHVKSIDNDT